HAHNARATANPLASGLRNLFRQHEHQINVGALAHALINEEENSVAADIARARLHFDSVALVVSELDLERRFDGNALRLALLWNRLCHYASYIGAPARQCQ